MKSGMYEVKCDQSSSFPSRVIKADAATKAPLFITGGSFSADIFDASLTLGVPTGIFVSIFEVDLFIPVESDD